VIRSWSGRPWRAPGASLAEGFTRPGTPTGTSFSPTRARWPKPPPAVSSPSTHVDLSVSDSDDAELFHTFLGRTFRCAVTEFASIEANLSIANMDFQEFADNSDTDGVFRGFKDGE